MIVVGLSMDAFAHLRHGGRVSSSAAMVGTALQTKPLLHVDERGCLQVAEKPRGRKNAIAAQLAKMEQGWAPSLRNLVVMGHGDAPDAAGQLREAVVLRFPEVEIHTTHLGSFIGRPRRPRNAGSGLLGQKPVTHRARCGHDKRVPKGPPLRLPSQEDGKQILL